MFLIRFFFFIIAGIFKVLFMVLLGFACLAGIDQAESWIGNLEFRTVARHVVTEVRESGCIECVLELAEHAKQAVAKELMS